MHDSVLACIFVIDPLERILQDLRLCIQTHAVRLGRLSLLLYIEVMVFSRVIRGCGYLPSGLGSYPLVNFIYTHRVQINVD